MAKLFIVAVAHEQFAQPVASRMEARMAAGPERFADNRLDRRHRQRLGDDGHEVSPSHSCAVPNEQFGESVQLRFRHGERAFP